MRTFCFSALTIILFSSVLALNAQMVARSSSVQFASGVREVAPATCSPAPCVIPEALMGATTNDSNFVVNPQNSQQWMSGGGDVSCPAQAPYGSFASNDGGATWVATCLPAVYPGSPLNSPGIFAYDLNNVVYATYNSRDSSSFYPIVLTTSTDNGNTWGPVRTVVPGSALAGMQSAVIDTTATSPFANSIYIAEFLGTSGSDVGAISVLSSHDGGKTFQTASVQPSTEAAKWGTYSELAVGKDGTVYLTYRLCNVANGSPCKIMFSRSTNGGTSWTKPRAAATVAAVPGQTIPNLNVNGQLYGVYQPGVIAVDNSSGPFAGKLYLVTYDWTGTFMQIVLTNSTDGGKTWGPLVPLAPTVTNDQFWPWISASSSGTVGITWLDRRDDPANVKYRAYLAISTDGGNVFGKNLPIDNGLEDANAVYLSILSTRNVWTGKALQTTWLSHGDLLGTVVGGAQFK